MPFLRHTLAHLSVAALLLVGCGKSHGSDDAGTDTGFDAGLDAPLMLDAPFDAGRDSSADSAIDSAIDSGIETCDAMDAQPIICPEFVCDGPPEWFWNGDECRPIECGSCVGDDCGRGVSSRDECEAAHAECDATLCRETDGEWMWWVEECGHRVCGSPTLEICEVGMPVCNCGLNGSFVAGVGCMTDVCPEIDPLPPEELCNSTGGTWGDFCCDSVCGERCADACVNPACDCPALQIFDLAIGCVDSAQCYDRRAGQTCEPEARCEAGTICCMNCGGAGCFGSECRAPLCDDDPDIDTCGNNLLVP